MSGLFCQSLQVVFIMSSNLLLYTYYHVNICYVSIIYCYNNRSGVGREWERNGSG